MPTKTTGHQPVHEMVLRPIIMNTQFKKKKKMAVENEVSSQAIKTYFMPKYTPLILKYKLLSSLGGDSSLEQLFIVGCFLDEKQNLQCQDM